MDSTWNHRLMIILLMGTDSLVIMIIMIVMEGIMVPSILQDTSLPQITVMAIQA